MVMWYHSGTARGPLDRVLHGFAPSRNNSNFIFLQSWFFLLDGYNLQPCLRETHLCTTIAKIHTLGVDSLFKLPIPHGSQDRVLIRSMNRLSDH